MPAHGKQSIFWIEPAEPLKQSLAAVIQKLATDYDAVDFIPHVTLHACPQAESTCIAAARQIAAQFKPFELTAEKIDHTDIFTKTLFVQFRESETLRRMHDIARAQAPPSSYALNPHLSLLYKKMPQAEQIKLAATLKAPMENYAFDTLCVLDMDSTATGADMIRSLRKAASFKLGTT